MRCDKIGPELVAYAHGELNPGERESVETHLQHCASCAAELQSFRELEVLLAGAALEQRPSPGLKQSAFERIEAEDLGILLSTTAAAAPPADLKRRAMSRALAEHGPRTAAKNGRRRTTWMAAAAAVVGIAVAAGSQMRVQDMDRRLASMQASIQHAEDSFGPVGHPMQAVQLAGRSGAAEAELSHFKHDNYRMTVKLDDIDVTPPDHHYEMWLAGEDGEVSVGSFRLKEPDDLTLNFTIGVDPGEFPEVLITLEKSDGDPRMSSRLVARAVLDRHSLYRGAYEE